MPEFSLFGGLLQRLGEKLGLVRAKTNTFRLGIALGYGAWCILMLLAWLQGTSADMFSLTVIGAHVRLLVAIPMFFACEALVAPRMAEFVRSIVRSGVVPETEQPVLASAIRTVGRINDNWVVELIVLLLVFAMPVIEVFTQLPGKTGNWTSILTSGNGFSLVNSWYLAVCLPLFRFLMIRWAWHLCLWWYFLIRVARLKLRLIPTHSDGVGGLGYLETVHEHFIPLVLAISAVLSSMFAEEIAGGTMAMEALYRLVPLVFLLIAVLFIVPLFTFVRNLWACRDTGLREYTLMASRYVDAFDRKWVRDEKVSGESQLGTGDIQSLADLTNSFRVVRDMRLAPVSRRLLIELAVCVIIPLVPHLFFKYNFDQLSVRVFNMLTGQ